MKQNPLVTDKLKDIYFFRNKKIDKVLFVTEEERISYGDRSNRKAPVYQK